jgi:hypothetical protein
MRAHYRFRPLGSVSRVEIFLSPPWINLETANWREERGLTDPLAGEVAAYFGQVPLSLYPLGRPLASVVRGIYPEDESVLLSNITGEVTELLLLQEGVISGRATLPHGHHLLLRTLRTHSGMSEEEARSTLRLPKPPVREALQAAGRHFTQEFRDTARQLVSPVTRSIVVAAHEPVGEWFARTLAEDTALEELFPHGGTIRALRAHHLREHLEPPAGKDIPLMLEALYIGARSSAPRYSGV